MAYTPPRRSDLNRQSSDPFITNIVEEPAGFEDSSVSSVENEPSESKGPSLEDVKSAAHYNIHTVRRMDSDVADNLQAFGIAYASKFSFWKSFLMSGFLGAIMGLLSFAFFWSFNLGLTNIFFTKTYQHSLVSTDFHPEAYWVWLPIAGGATIGIIKLLPLGRYSFPLKIHGFFRKVSSFEVHPNEAPIVILVAILSLASGGTVGPEAALGWMGCGLAITIWGYIENFGDRFIRKAEENPNSKFWAFMSEPLVGMNQSVLALDAISAGLGAMFPTPALAILIMHELTLAAGLNIFAANYMERVTTSLFGAIISWVIFNKLGGKHVLPNFGDGSFGEVPGAAHSWEMELCLTDNPLNKQHFLMNKMFTSILLGLVGSGVGLFCLLEMGLLRNIAMRIKTRMKQRKRPKLATFLLPTIAGIAVGCVGYHLPLTYGDGSYQLGFITKNLIKSDLDDVTAQYDSSYLIKTVVADLSLLAICQGFGFVGGQIFPTMFAGYLCGIVAYDRYNVAFDVAVPCLMCAVPCAFVPTPFTFVFMVAILFGLDGIHTTYVLIAVITSFGANCGLGLVQEILLSKLRKDLKAGARPNDFHTGFSGDANDPFSNTMGGKIASARQQQKSRTYSDGFGYGLRPSAMSEILALTFFGDEGDEDTDEEDINNIFSVKGLTQRTESQGNKNITEINTLNNAGKSRVKSVNDAAMGRSRRQLSRGSVLGPRAMTATFGSSHGMGRYPTQYEMDPFASGHAPDYGKGSEFHDGYEDPANSHGPYTNLGDYDINGDLDQLRTSANGLSRARSSGPGIVSNGFKPSVLRGNGSAMMERERGRGPSSLEARVAAAQRYNSSDALNKTQF